MAGKKDDGHDTSDSLFRESVEAFVKDPTAEGLKKLIETMRIKGEPELPMKLMETMIDFTIPVIHGFWAREKVEVTEDEARYVHEQLTAISYDIAHKTSNELKDRLDSVIRITEPTEGLDN